MPGWNELVEDKHVIARALAAYLDWMSAGKPRRRYYHRTMCSTRADFKLALRHCKNAEEQMKADAG